MSVDQRSTLLCRKMTWVHPVVSFPQIIFPCPRACMRIWSRETGSAVPSRVSLLISILRLNLVLSHRPSKWNDAQYAEWKVSTERAYRKMMMFVDLRHGQETLRVLTTKNID